MNDLLETFEEEYNEIYDALENIRNAIEFSTSFDIENFKQELENEGLLNEELEEFINHYRKYHMKEK